MKIDISAFNKNKTFYKRIQFLRDRDSIVIDI